MNEPTKKPLVLWMVDVANWAWAIRKKAIEAQTPNIEHRLYCCTRKMLNDIRYDLGIIKPDIIVCFAVPFAETLACEGFKNIVAIRAGYRLECDV
jgi:hypothetical protein